MWKRIERWLHIDSVADRRERMVLVSLDLTLGFAILITGVLAFFYLADGVFGTAGVMGAAMLGCLVMLGLAVYGRAGWVKWLFPGLIYLVVTRQAARYSGLLDEAIFAYPALICLAGLLLGRSGIVAFTALSLAGILGIGYRQLYPQPVELTYEINLLQMATLVMLVGVTGVILYRLSDILLNSLRNLEIQQQELAQVNHELQGIQAGLEQRVIERTRHAEAAREQAEAARKEAEAARQAIEDQAWLAAGRVRLNEAWRGEQRIADLARNALQTLCQYADIPVAVFFLMEGDNLRQLGGCALAGAQEGKTFQLGEGLVGQAALERRSILLDAASAGELILRTGRGEMSPRQVFIQPICNDQTVVGVLETAVLQPFSPRQLQFLQQIESGMAIAFQTAQARQRVNELLAETQRQAEELQAQEEELRAANEELQAQAESLHTQSKRPRR